MYYKHTRQLISICLHQYALIECDADFYLNMLNSCLPMICLRNISVYFKHTWQLISICLHQCVDWMWCWFLSQYVDVTQWLVSFCCTMLWCQAVIKYVNTSRGPLAFGRSTKLNDKAIIWSKLRLGVDTHQMDTMIGERLQIKPHLLSHTSVTLLSQLLQRTFYARPIRWRIVDIANAMLATVTIATIATVMLMESFFW